MATWRIHHANVMAHDVRQSAEFYTNVLGMQATDPDFKPDYRSDREVAWFEAEGSAQLHISKPITTFARDSGFHLDPILRGHVAITVDDIEAVKGRLRDRGVYFADPGNWALNDYYQIYTYDPSMNCLEINQRQ